MVTMTAKKTPTEGVSKGTPSSGTSTFTKERIKSAIRKGEGALDRRTPDPDGMSIDERMSYAPTISSEISVDDTMPSPPGGQRLPSAPGAKRNLYGYGGPESDGMKTGEIEVSQELLEKSRKELQAAAGKGAKPVTPPGTQTELKTYLNGEGQTGIRKQQGKRRNRVMKIMAIVAWSAAIALAGVAGAMAMGKCSSCGKDSDSKGSRISKETREALRDEYITPETLLWTRGRAVPIKPGDVIGRDGKPIDADNVKGLVEFLSYGAIFSELSKEQAEYMIINGSSKNGKLPGPEREKHVVSELMEILKTADSPGHARVAGRMLAEMHPTGKLDDLVRLINKEDFEWEREAGVALLGIVEYHRRKGDNLRYDRMPFFVSLIKKDKDSSIMVSMETYAAAVIGIGLTKGNRIGKLKEIIEEDYCDTCGFQERYKVGTDTWRNVHPALIGLVAAGARGEKGVDLLLVEYLKSGNSDLRGDAAWALGEFSNDPTEIFRPLIVNGADVQEALSAGLADDDPDVREECARSLGKLMLAGSVPELIKAAEGDPDEDVRAAAGNSVKLITGMEPDGAAKQLAAAGADAAADAAIAGDAAGEAAADVPAPEPEAAPVEVFIPVMPEVPAHEPEPGPIDLGEQAVEGEVKAEPEKPEKKPPKKKGKKKKKKKPKEKKIEWKIKTVG